jgi:hypothetical protein
VFVLVQIVLLGSNQACIVLFQEYRKLKLQIERLETLLAENGINRTDITDQLTNS